MEDLFGVEITANKNFSFGMQIADYDNENVGFFYFDGNEYYFSDADDLATIRSDGIKALNNLITSAKAAIKQLTKLDVSNGDFQVGDKVTPVADLTVDGDTLYADGTVYEIVDIDDQLYILDNNWYVEAGDITLV